MKIETTKAMRMSMLASFLCFLLKQASTTSCVALFKPFVFYSDFRQIEFDLKTSPFEISELQKRVTHKVRNIRVASKAKPNKIRKDRKIHRDNVYSQSCIPPDHWLVKVFDAECYFFCFSF